MRGVVKVFLWHKCWSAADKMLYKNVICLLIGVIIGVRLTDLWELILNTKYNNNKNNQKQQQQQQQLCYETYINLQKQQQQQQQQQKQEETQILQNRLNFSIATTTSTIIKSKKIPSLSTYLFNNTRILCWVLTSPQNHLKRALHVKRTWGKRCNRLLFMSSRVDRFLNTIKLNVPEGRDFLWRKTREALKYLYDHHYHEADWFLKADDDTYIIMENLREFLYPLSTSAPVYFGCKFHPFVKEGYMSGGAGYVLSKEALKRFAVEAYVNASICPANNRSEDKELGLCLRNVGVIAGDARDSEGRERFNALAPQHLIPVDTSEWYKQYLFYKPHGSCCSGEAISFHYIKPKDFYLLDYYLYVLRPFGVVLEHHLPSEKSNMSALMEKWRHDLSDNIFKTDDN